MTYALYKLAAGSYDLELDGRLIGGVVRSPSDHPTWTVELLSDAPREARPSPFTEIEHTFSSLAEALEWLGRAEIKGSR